MMKDPYGLSKASIPAAYAQIVLEILAERGFAPTQVLHDCPLSATQFSVPDGRLTPRQWSRLVWLALRLTGDDGLGYEYGLRLRPTAHGVLGYALMSCATLGQALELGVAFLSMRLRDYRIELRIKGDTAMIDIAETHPVMDAVPEQARMLRRFFHECVVIGLLQAGHYATGRDFSAVEVWVDWPEPPSHARYRDRLPPMRFNMPTNQIRFPLDHLQWPMIMADPMAFQQALTQCEQERIRFAETIDDLAARVRAELILEPGAGFPGLEVVAEKLHISGRTLKRRLQILGTSFLEVLENAQRQEAERQLTTTDMAIQDIASLLGYTGPANFARAFRKWTGETPSQFRARVRIEDPAKSPGKSQKS